MTPMLRGAVVTQAAPSYIITQSDIDTLVSLSEANGIDPVDVAVVLYTESAGFNPASLGPGGSGAYTGLNQMSVANLTHLGIAPMDWVTYSAAEQLPVIFKFWSSLEGDNNGRFPQDAAVLTALNFVPGTYKNVGAWANRDAILAATPGINYVKNTWYDPDGTGTITVNTIAKRVAMAKASSDSRWQNLVSMIRGLVPAPAPVATSGGQGPVYSTGAALASAGWTVAGITLLGGAALGAAIHHFGPRVAAAVRPARGARRRRVYA